MSPYLTPTPRARVTKALLIALPLAAMFAHATPVSSDLASAAPMCRPEGTIVRVPGLPEGSGIAVSRRDPRRAWAHNDSGRPVLVSLDDRGVVTGRFQVTGAGVEDWEAVAAGPCAAGSCLYIGDIGDNDAERKRITIYRVPEPEGGSRSVSAHDAFHAVYPDGAHDAETLLVTPEGDLFIVTKGDTGPVAIYRLPRRIERGATVELERVGKPRDPGPVGSGDRITDGAVSPSGSWVALRTNHDVRFYAAADLLAGNWREAGRLNLKPLGEPQGEGLAFASDSLLYLVGEGGGKSQAGTFARLTCVFDENSGR